MQSNNQLQKVFEYNGSQVRTVIKDGNPWFVAKDVCDVLEIDPCQTRRLDEDEKDTLRLTQETSGNPYVTIVNEPGLYSLILGSRKSEAKTFKRWVTHEVLPAIRQTGSYSMQPKSQLEIMLNQNETIQELLVKMIQKEQEDQERDRLLAEVKQEASLAHQRINTLDMIEPQGNLRQQLVSKVGRLRLCRGITYSMAWQTFISAYNNAYNTNLELCITHHYKKTGKKMTRPEFLEFKGCLNEAHRVIDKLLHEAA